MITRQATRRRLRLVAGAASLLCGLVLVVGPTDTLASALNVGPPADCAAVLAHPATSGGGSRVDKTETGASTSNGSTTYTFDINTFRPTATFTNLEDCAYANGDPTNIKYGTQTINPVFSGSHATITLTVDAKDTICDRVKLSGHSQSNVPFDDYTNLLGSANGATNPAACVPTTVVPEVPATGLLALAGLGVAGAAVVVWRRREADTELTEG